MLLTPFALALKATRLMDAIVAPQPGHAHLACSLLIKLCIPETRMDLRFSIMLIPYFAR